MPSNFSFLTLHPFAEFLRLLPSDFRSSTYNDYKHQLFLCEEEDIGWRIRINTNPLINVVLITPSAETNSSDFLSKIAPYNIINSSKYDHEDRMEYNLAVRIYRTWGTAQSQQRIETGTEEVVPNNYNMQPRRSRGANSDFQSPWRFEDF